MTLEQQVTSLELSQKLKELGVKQESLFYWTYCPRFVQDGEWVHALTYGRNNKLSETVSAFTVAELGEMLPSGFASHRYGNKWFCLMRTKERDEEGNTEADARAKMLIYLIENKLLALNTKTV